eukprot:COSAG06_NODE_26257_length_618_cov_1.714836_1_plen_39_part_10
MRVEKTQQNRGFLAEWNAVRSAEDVYHDGQRVEAYTIEA